MKTISKEQEYSLIKELLDLEKQLHIHDMEKMYCNTPSEKLKNESEQKVLKASIVKISNNLIEIDNPQASKEIKDFLVRFLYQMKAAFPM
jgi:hypothetical protein